MTKEQAYQLLVQATAMLKVTREEHQTIAKALDVFKPEEEKKK